MAMIELPRNPTDITIDGLSQAALDWLYAHGDLESVRITRKHYGEMLFPEERPEVHEVVRAGFFNYVKSDWVDPGEYVMLVRQWTGYEVIERLKCGVYHHAKKIYEAREARDAALEANPLYGIF